MRSISFKTSQVKSTEDKSVYHRKCLTVIRMEEGGQAVPEKGEKVLLRRTLGTQELVCRKDAAPAPESIFRPLKLPNRHMTFVTNNLRFLRSFESLLFCKQVNRQVFYSLFMLSTVVPFVELVACPCSGVWSPVGHAMLDSSLKPVAFHGSFWGVKYEDNFE